MKMCVLRLTGGGLLTISEKYYVKKLHESRNYNDVINILSDKPFHQRVFEANMKMLVGTVGNGQLKVSGGRIQLLEDEHRERHRPRYDNNKMDISIMSSQTTFIMTSFHVAKTT